MRPRQVHAAHDGQAIHPAVGQGSREGLRGPRTPAQPGQLGREIQHLHVRGPVGFADHGQRAAHPASCDLRIVIDRRQVVGHDLMIRGTDLGAREGQVLGGHRLGEDAALGDPAGQLE